MARPRRRAGAREDLFVYESVSAVCRMTRRISRREGERMVLSGSARRVLDSNRSHVGYELVERPLVLNGDVASRPTPAVITAREMELIAGTCFVGGGSRTASMSETQRLTRVHEMTRRPLPPEDEIERAMARLEGFAPMHLRMAS